MSSSIHENSGRPSAPRLWKLALLACVLGSATWLISSFLISRSLPADFPKLPDPQLQNAALRRLLAEADGAARKRPDSAADIGRLGMVYHANQFYDQAEDSYRIASRLEPSDYRWTYCQALVKEETGQEKEVHELLQKAVRLKPDYFPALQKLGEIYYKQDRMDQAAHYYELSAGAAGKDASLQAVFGLGRIAARRKDWNKVVEYVAPLSHEYPHIRPPHQLLLDAYEATGQNDRAAEERRHLLEPNLIVIPLLKDPLGEELLGLSCSSTRLLKEAGLYSRFRQPDEAIRVARRAAEVAPEDADAHHFLARTLLEAHGADSAAVDDALSHLSSGLRLRPDDLLPLWYFATIFFRQAKSAAAVEQLRTLLAQSGDRAEAHYYIGLVAERQGRVEEAVAQYQEALKSDPGSAEAYHKLGLILVTKGRFDQAIVYFQKAIRLKPMFILARCNLGVALEVQGKTGQAIAQFEEALRIKPNDATTQRYLAIALMRSGKTAEAADHFRETIRFAPDDAEAHYGLGCALAMRGRIEEGSQELREALRLRPDYMEARNQLQQLERRKP